MEKVTLKLKKKGFTKVKFGTQEFKIKTVLSLVDIEAYIRTVIDKITEEKMFNIAEDTMHLSVADTVLLYGRLQMYIISEYTNIDIEDVEYADLNDSGVIPFVLSKIENYSMVEEILASEIARINVHLMFINAVEDMIDPSTQNTEQALAELDEQLQELQKTNPELAKLIMNENILDTLRTEAKKEVTSPKEEVKRKLKNNQKVS